MKETQSCSIDIGHAPKLLTLVVYRGPKGGGTSSYYHVLYILYVIKPSFTHTFQCFIYQFRGSFTIVNNYVFLQGVGGGQRPVNYMKIVYLFVERFIKTNAAA